MKKQNNDKRAKFTDYFEFIRHLGKGSFARVVLARDRSSNINYAVKVH